MIEAEYEGICGVCGSDIELGDEISNDDGYGWCHIECS